MSGVGPDPVRLLVDSLRIYSPTGKEQKLASYICRQMKNFGYRRVRIDRAGNATGEIGRGKRKLLLCGHMDTIPGELPVRVKGHHVYGRGAADAKSALCALLVAGSRAAGASLSITFVGATREESDGLGIQTIVRSRKKFDYAIFGEPSGAGRVTIGYRGRVGMRLVLRTKGGHAGSPWAHTSAVDKFYEVLSSFRDYERRKTLANDHFRSLTITPTIVEAGSFHNVVPPVCSVTFDVRLPPGTKGSEVSAALRRNAADAVAGSASIEMHFGEATEAYEADPNSTLVRAFQRAVIIAMGAKPTLVRKTGTGDMNTLASAMKVQCVTYGPGDSKLSHTDSESVSVKDYFSSIRVLAEAIVQIEVLDGAA